MFFYAFCFKCYRSLGHNLTFRKGKTEPVLRQPRHLVVETPTTSPRHNYMTHGRASSSWTFLYGAWMIMAKKTSWPQGSYHTYRRTLTTRRTAQAWNEFGRRKQLNGSPCTLTSLRLVLHACVQAIEAQHIVCVSNPWW